MGAARGVTDYYSHFQNPYSTTPEAESNILIGHRLSLYLNGTTNQAIASDPFNNLLDKHSIVGVSPASAITSAPSPNDILTLLPARSVSLTVTFGYVNAH